MLQRVTPADPVARAIAFRLGSVIGFSTMGALIKLAENAGAHLIELLFWRQFGALPIVLVWLLAGPGLATIRSQRMGAHALRAATGLVSMSFVFSTLLILPLAEATTILFTVPIFATILSALVLREPTGIHRWGAVGVGFIGVLVVTQPGSGTIPLAGVATGLIGALLSASVTVMLRQIGRTEPAPTTVFWFSALTAPVLGLLYAFNLEAHSPHVWLLLFAVGAVGGVAQMFMTASLRAGDVALVVPMDYASLLLATLFGWALFGVLPTAATWMGAPIIIASSLYIVWRERRRARPVSPAISTES